MPIYKYGKAYDPTIRKTEIGKNLYNIWRRIRRHPHSEEFDYFPAFYEWAMDSGYDFKARLIKTNENKPFSKENCTWHITDEYEIDEEWVADFTKKWNKSVNRIRNHYGMPPLEGTKYGD